MKRKKTEMKRKNYAKVYKIIDKNIYQTNICGNMNTYTYTERERVRERKREREILQVMIILNYSTCE